MAQQSRVYKSLLNARVSLIYYLLFIVLSFFSRKIFLDSLGADFMGLGGTLSNILGFLSLAEQLLPIIFIGPLNRVTGRR